MKDEKKSASGQTLMGGLFLVAGLIVALIIGWVVFPKVLYSQKTQPISFNHAAHQDSSCEDCHYFQPDGSYSGIPDIENCRQCHEEPMTDSEDERILVEEYIQKDREIPWLVYQWQPDNVFFSHAPHQAAEIECVTCHRDVTGEQEETPVLHENRWTGYSKSTMKMISCEKCHAERGATNACQACHK
jgi:menaquinone reductase, multiheme cytochrome c subunit